MEIISLDPRQMQQASIVLSASFFDYPSFTFYFPDPNRRARYLPWFFQSGLKIALRYGEVYTTSSVSGVSLILPPVHTKISLWEVIQSYGLTTPFRMGFRNFKHWIDCESFVEGIHGKLMKNRSHYYLWGLAVDPNHKSKGIGSALMEPVMAKADAQKLPVYLETHNEKNIRFYEKHGFKLIHTVRIPKCELPIMCMLREPT